MYHEECMLQVTIAFLGMITIIGSIVHHVYIYIYIYILLHPYFAQDLVRYPILYKHHIISRVDQYELCLWKG